MGSPIAVEVRRRTVATGPRYAWGREHNAHDFERIYPQLAPDPIRYGATPSRPSRQWITFFTNIPGYLAVMADNFLGTVQFPQPSADRPRSYGNLPWRERANIPRPQPEAYGSLISQRLASGGQTDPFAPEVPSP